MCDARTLRVVLGRYGLSRRDCFIEAPCSKLQGISILNVSAYSRIHIAALDRFRIRSILPALLTTYYEQFQVPLKFIFQVS